MTYTEKLGHGKVKVKNAGPVDTPYGKPTKVVRAEQVGTDHGRIANAFALKGRTATLARRLMRGKV